MCGDPECCDHSCVSIVQYPRIYCQICMYADTYCMYCTYVRTYCKKNLIFSSVRESHVQCVRTFHSVSVLGK